MTRRACDLEDEETQPVIALPPIRDPFWALPLAVQREVAAYLDDAPPPERGAPMMGSVDAIDLSRREDR